MTKIFISYRRDDAGFAADRVHQAALEYVSDPKDVFMDIDGIPPGVDFVDHINQQVGQCDVLFALIGPDWLDARDAETQARRLDDPNDFVRNEIASALGRKIPVVPVLLGDVEMPNEDALPANLKSLARRNAMRVGRQSFQSDMTQLMSKLGLVPKETSSFKGGWLFAAALVAVLGAIGVYGLQSGWFGQSSDPRQETVPAIPEGAELRTRTLGLSITQSGQPVPLHYTEGEPGQGGVSTFKVKRGAFTLRVPNRYWSDLQDSDPLVHLAVSDQDVLFDAFSAGDTNVEETLFSFACAGANYEFGSPDIWPVDTSLLFNGQPCGFLAYNANQFSKDTGRNREILISTVTPIGSEEDLIASADRLQMLVFIPNDDNQVGRGEAIVYSSEIEKIELVFIN